MPPKDKNSSKMSTVSFDSAPSFIRSNCYIKKGYRKKLTILQCFQSALRWNNETINIWSHLIGFILFIVLFIYDSTIVYKGRQVSFSDIVLACFVLLAFMVCMLLSTLYHTLNCHSLHSCQKWLTLDLFGVSVAFFAIFLSGIYYGFWCQEHAHLRYIYSGFVCVLFAAAMALLLLPRFKGDEWNQSRILLFVLWSISGLLPTLHWTLIHRNSYSNIVKTFLPRIFYMYAISGSAFVIYFFKIPEFIFPGYFDYIGASHQLWHVIIVGALFFWHDTGLDCALHREKYGCDLFP